MHKKILTWSDRVRNLRGLIFGLAIALLASTLPASNSPFISNAEASYGDYTCELTGEGSPPNPYQIVTAANLWEAIDCIDGIETKYFVVTADIQTDGTGVTAYPIGVFTDGLRSTQPFQDAWIDGQGFEISYSMSVNDDAAGLFHTLQDVTISNLALRGSVAKTSGDGSGDTSKNIGGLANKITNTVILDSISSNVTVAGDFNVGGLVGTSAGLLKLVNVANYGNVSGSGDYIGGLVGYDAPGSSIDVVSSSNFGTVTGQYYVGGLVGLSRNGTATFSSVLNSGTVSATGGHLGGVLGGFYSTATVSMTSVVNSGGVSVSAGSIGRVAGIVGSSLGHLTLISVSNEAVIAGERYTGGLIGLHTGPGLVVSGSQNVGAVSGANDVGGLAGELDGSGVATLSDVSNLASVLGTEYVGGLVGYIDIETRFVRAKNEGSVQATTDLAAGLVGYADEDTNNLSIELSFNSGTVTVANSNKDAGGLLGWSEGVFYSIIDSYNSGRIVSDRIGPIVGWDGDNSINEVLTRVAAFPAPSQATTEDGLVAGYASDVTATAVYTFEASTLVSSSTIAELKSASTYTGWDFDSVWAFGGCDLNNGYPVLRWAHEGVTFFDQSCGVNSSSSPVVSSGGSGGSTPAPTRTPTAYAGPILDASRVVVEPGTTHTLSGKRLQTIHTVRIEGLNAAVLILTSTSLTITLPASLTPGTYDLVVFSAHGKLTVNAKFEVVKAKKVIDAETEEVTDAELSGPRTFGVLLGFQWSARFIGNSRDLSQLQVRGVSESLEGYPAATTVVCWGYTTETTPGDWAIEHATKRAEGLCNAVAGLREDVKLYVRVRFGQSKFAAMRATMQFWESKQPI